MGCHPLNVPNKKHSRCPACFALYPRLIVADTHLSKFRRNGPCETEFRGYRRKKNSALKGLNLYNTNCGLVIFVLASNVIISAQAEFSGSNDHIFRRVTSVVFAQPPIATCCCAALPLRLTRIATSWST